MHSIRHTPISYQCIRVRFNWGLLHSATLALLDQIAETGAMAPTLWPLEILNGLAMAERRGRLDTARRHQLAGFLRDLPVSRLAYA